MIKYFLTATILFLSFSTHAQQSARDSLVIARIAGNHPAAFVLFNKLENKYTRFNASRCAERFLPASTFKIPNSLIGLESGVISDENYMIRWDGVKRWNADWNRNHTLASAIKFSVVPYYQELARRVGREKYDRFLNEIDYGNKTAGAAIDTFWLDNSLKISADEQVEFLKKFYDYKLSFSKRSIDIVKKIIPEEKYSGSTLKFKTGTGKRENGAYIGRVIGYVEKGENVFFYAFNIEADDADAVRTLRDDSLRKILRELKLIE